MTMTQKQLKYCTPRVWHWKKEGFIEKILKKIGVKRWQD